MSLSVVNWNVEWATPRSGRSPEILQRIGEHDPEIVCLTEADNRLLSREGYTICSQPDYGYSTKAGRRKVMLWSRNPWDQVDDVGTASIPPGRFVSGLTRTSLGTVTVVGVCIPWFGSRTRDKRRERWEDHGQYLVGLTEILQQVGKQPLIVMGDFNQIVGHTTGARSRAPREQQLALQRAFHPNLTIVTDGLAFQGRNSIDHIALSPRFKVETVGAISNNHEGKKLSDHFGVFARLSSAPID